MNNEAMGEAMNVDEQQDSFAILPPELRAMIFKHFNDADLENISTLSTTFDKYANEEREYRYKDRKIVVRADSNLSDLRDAFETIPKSSRTITGIKWSTGNDRFVSEERMLLLRNVINKHYKTTREIEISSSLFGLSGDMYLAIRISDQPVLKRLKVRFELNHSTSMNNPWRFLKGIMHTEFIEELELDFDAPNCEWTNVQVPQPPGQPKEPEDFRSSHRRPWAQMLHVQSHQKCRYASAASYTFKNRQLRSFAAPTNRKFGILGDHCKSIY